MYKKTVLPALILVISSILFACNYDSNSNEEMPSELVKGNERSDNGGDVNNGDDSEEVTTWPSEDEMASQTYYPIGTKWQETWAATRMKDKNCNGIKPVYQAPRRINSEYKDLYEDTPYDYFTMTFEIDKDTIVNGNTLHHVTISHDFTAPTDRRTDYPLIDGDYNDFYIEEYNGVIYMVGEYSLEADGDNYHKDLAYDFVWTEGKELSHVKLCYYDGFDTDDEMEVVGTVTKSTVKMKRLCDGTHCLYMPTANLYRGIGCITGSMFLGHEGILTTTLFEVVREPIGLTRFYRDGVLLYENNEVID